LGDTETKAAANIPAEATCFAWAYPMVLEPGTQRPQRAEIASFIDYGGYIYFDDNRNVVGTNAIVPAPLVTLGLMFGRPQPLPENIVDRLTKQGRFQEISLASFADKGATHFAWIRPGEFSNEIASSDGCFAYTFKDCTTKYYPVVNKPVFTKELLDEELDEHESWVVVRTTFPSVESSIVYDKRKTLEENLYSNMHGSQLTSQVAHVKIGRDSDWHLTDIRGVGSFCQPSITCRPLDFPALFRDGARSNGGRCVRNLHGVSRSEMLSCWLKVHSFQIVQGYSALTPLLLCTTQSSQSRISATPCSK